jgi:membrane protein
VVLRAVQAYLSQNLPSLDAQALREARGTAGLVAFVVPNPGRRTDAT